MKHNGGARFFDCRSSVKLSVFMLAPRLRNIRHRQDFGFVSMILLRSSFSNVSSGSLLMLATMLFILCLGPNHLLVTARTSTHP